MTLFQAVVLGVVQGLTEFFPISSSGHLVILQSLFGMKEPQLEFDIFLHAGTLVAVMIFFAKDIAKLFTTERKTLWLLIIASIPTFIIGFFFKDRIEALFSSPGTTGIMLMVTGVLLIGATAVSGYIAGRNIERRLGTASSLAIGIAQGIAVIPGISRSGATIATGMLYGLNRDTAFRFAFLLSLPAVGGACVLKAHKIKAALSGGEALIFLAGGFTAMVVGLATIGLLLRLVKQNKLYIFGIYCIAAGAMAAMALR